MPLSPPSVSSCVWLSDAHFHLNQMLKVFGAKGLEVIVEKVPIGTNLPQLHLATANYMYSNSWDKIKQVHPDTQLVLHCWPPSSYDLWLQKIDQVLCATS